MLRANFDHSFRIFLQIDRQGWRQIYLHLSISVVLWTFLGTSNLNHSWVASATLSILTSRGGKSAARFSTTHMYIFFRAERQNFKVSANRRETATLERNRGGRKTLKRLLDMLPRSRDLVNRPGTSRSCHLCGLYAISRVTSSGIIKIGEMVRVPLGLPRAKFSVQGDGG